MVVHIGRAAQVRMLSGSLAMRYVDLTQNGWNYMAQAIHTDKLPVALTKGGNNVRLVQHRMTFIPRP